MHVIKKLSSIVPGLAAPVVAKWLDLFVNTPLVLPQWQASAQLLSLGIGTVVATVLCLLYGHESEFRLRRRAKVLFILTLIGFVACLAFWWVLGRAFSDPIASLLQDTWFVVFVATMSVMVATITLASLSLADAHSSVFWIIVAIAVLVVVAVVLALIFL